MTMEAPSTPDRPLHAELLLVSPLASGKSRPQSQKRRVTPSYEARSPKQIAVVLRPGPSDPLQSKIKRPDVNALRWPAVAQEALIDAREPLQPFLFGKSAHTRGPPLQSSTLLPKAQQITVPFDLQNNPQDYSKPENMEILSRIFPGTKSVGCDDFFLFIYVSEMPPKPWPKTIAGLPLYLALNPGPDFNPMPMGDHVPSKNGSIADNLNGRHMEPWTPLFDAIRIHFLTLQISITQVMYWDNYLIIVLEHRGVDTTKLPSRAGQIMCTYLYDDQIGSPRFPQARRQTDPTPGNPDQTQYEMLQPGMRVTSGYIPDKPGMFQATTTGVLVKDSFGNEYMTVAAHGFPAECGTDVNHALPSNGRKIGEMIYEISHTDIALVKLSPDEKFVNVTFESENITEPVRLKHLVRSKETKKGDLVLLDSPDTGYIEGILLGQAYQRVPTDDVHELEQHWIFSKWYYMGQDSGTNLQAGMCGSAIWTQEGQVVGFFRYAPGGENQGVMKDWCTAIAADVLIDKGFTLVDTSDREQ